MRRYEDNFNEEYERGFRAGRREALRELNEETENEETKTKMAKLFKIIKSKVEELNKENINRGYKPMDVKMVADDIFVEKLKKKGKPYYIKIEDNPYNFMDVKVDISKLPKTAKKRLLSYIGGTGTWNEVLDTLHPFSYCHSFDDVKKVIVKLVYYFNEAD